MPSSMQTARLDAVAQIPKAGGVYVLCDLDFVPIYVGKSEDMNDRVSRHLTSARSDVIANRQLDVWEIAEVWYCKDNEFAPLGRRSYEENLINYYNDQSPLVNGKIPKKTAGFAVFTPSAPHKVTVLPPSEVEFRKNSLMRLPRQLDQLDALFRHILEVKNNSEQRRMLRVHFNRMKEYYEDFMVSHGDDI